MQKLNSSDKIIFKNNFKSISKVKVELDKYVKLLNSIKIPECHKNDFIIKPLYEIHNKLSDKISMFSKNFSVWEKQDGYHDNLLKMLDDKLLHKDRDFLISQKELLATRFAEIKLPIDGFEQPMKVLENHLIIKLKKFLELYQSATKQLNNENNPFNKIYLETISNYLIYLQQELKAKPYFNNKIDLSAMEDLMQLESLFEVKKQFFKKIISRTQVCELEDKYLYLHSLNANLDSFQSNEIASFIERLPEVNEDVHIIYQLQLAINTCTASSKKNVLLEHKPENLEDAKLIISSMAEVKESLQKKLLELKNKFTQQKKQKKAIGELLEVLVSKLDEVDFNCTQLKKPLYDRASQEKLTAQFAKLQDFEQLDLLELSVNTTLSKVEKSLLDLNNIYNEQRNKVIDKIKLLKFINKPKSYNEHLTNLEELYKKLVNSARETLNKKMLEYIFKLNSYNIVKIPLSQNNNYIAKLESNNAELLSKKGEFSELIDKQTIFCYEELALGEALNKYKVLVEQRAVIVKDALKLEKKFNNSLYKKLLKCVKNIDAKILNLNSINKNHLVSFKAKINNKLTNFLEKDGTVEQLIIDIRQLFNLELKDLEKYSESENNAFVQWLRKNILAPIVKALDRSNYSFFTPMASDTEEFTKAQCLRVIGHANQKA